jgi:hypothetical protein
MATWAAFLSDLSHTIVFHDTSKHAPWMNDVDLWFSMLVRKLLKPGNFTSVAALKAQVRRFIVYFTRMMAKPFKTRSSSGDTRKTLA